MKKTRVLIDASIVGDGSSGGMQQFLIGLASGLSKLRETDMEYCFITHWKNPGWLQPYLDSSMKTISIPRQHKKRDAIKSIMSPFRDPVLKMWRLTKKQVGLNADFMPPRLPPSSGFVETLSADLLHQTYPVHYFQTTIPNVCTIYDLQHCCPVRGLA